MAKVINVLLIEDEETNCRLWQGIINAERYHDMVCNHYALDVESGLARVAADKPDVVVMGWFQSAEHMTGQIANIQKISPATAVAVLGYDNSLKEAILEAGAGAYLGFPRHPGEIPNAIRRAYAALREGSS